MSKNQNFIRHHIEMYLSPQGHRVIRVIKSYSSERPNDYEQSYYPTKNKDNFKKQKESILEGKPYNPNEPQDTLDGNAYKILSQFHPSSWDHHTIATEFHQHLHKHGYYMHTTTHPLVMSPKDQAFKSGFKRKQREVKGLRPDPTHEVPHHDGSINRIVDSKSKMGTMGRFVALWSSQKHIPIEDQNPSGVSTRLYTKDGKEVGKQRERDSYVVLNNDSENKHAAGPEHNRWFIRAGEIRKIPPEGISAPTGKKGEIKHYGNDHDSYIKDRLYNQPTHYRDLLDFSNDKTSNYTPEQKEKVMNYVKQNHPEFHDLLQSDKLGKTKKITGEKNPQPYFVK